MPKALVVLLTEVAGAADDLRPIDHPGLWNWTELVGSPTICLLAEVGELPSEAALQEAGFSMPSAFRCPFCEDFETDDAFQLDAHMAICDVASDGSDTI